MVTPPRGYVEIRSTIPEHLRDAIYSEIIERCGYLRRGLIGEVIREAIQEYADKKEYEKSKAITAANKKNGLALYNRGDNKRINTCIKNAITVDMLIAPILGYASKPRSDHAIRGAQTNHTIGVGLVRKAIQQKLGVKTRRTIDEYIEMLVNSKVLETLEFDEKNGKPASYIINLESIKKEGQIQIES